ncbi:MAG: TIGR04086 family membrane protein [Clostridia bacterium]
MLAKTTNMEVNIKKNVLNFFLAGIISVILSLGLILIFALCIKVFSLTDSWITPVNYIIKIVSIFIATLIITKDGKHGMKKGIIMGLFYTVFATIVFSVIAGQFIFDISLALDLGFGILLGAICGIISVNIPRKSRI